MLTHPAVVVGVVLVLTPWAYQTVVRPESLRFVVLHQASAEVQLPMLLVAAGSLLATASVAGRSARFGTEELYDSLVMPRWHRRGAHLAATTAPAIAGTVLAVLRLGSLATSEGAVGRISFAELFTVTAVVLLGGVVGVAAGSLIRSVAAGALASAVLAAVVLAALLSTSPNRWLAPVAAEDPFSAVVVPSSLVVRPAWVHVAWLATVIAVVTIGALWAAGLPPAFGASGLAIALLLAGFVGFWQLEAAARDPEATLTQARTTPSEIQHCETRAGVTYCAFGEFSDWIDAWAELVDGQVALLPSGVAADLPAIRQQLPARSENFVPQPIAWEALAADNRSAGTPGALPVSTRWAGAGSENFEETEVLALAIQVAMALTGVESPDGAAGAEACGGRGAVAFWLAFQPASAASAALATDIARRQGAVAGATAEVLRSGEGVWIGPGERELGEQMLALDPLEIQDRLDQRWPTLVDPDTTVEEAADVLGLPGPSLDYSDFICS